MKPAIAIFVFGLGSVLLLNAQFGGIINKAKSKVDSVTQKPQSEMDKANAKAKPVTDRAAKASDSFGQWSPEEEDEIGQAGAAKMIAMFGVVDAPKLEKYVGLVGASVAQFSPRDMLFRFGVLNTDIIGSFALPGGYIFITRGALNAMENEAELAGVLGHEIIHTAERHLETEVRSSAKSKWAVEEGRTYATAPSEADFLRKKADALMSDMFNTRLSRDKEEGADIRGSQLAVSAGYAPDGLLNFLRTLERVKSQPGSKQSFGQLLATHPPFEERIATLEPATKKGPAGQTLEVRFQAAFR